MGNSWQPALRVFPLKPRFLNGRKLPEKCLLVSVCICPTSAAAMALSIPPMPFVPPNLGSLERLIALSLALRGAEVAVPLISGAISSGAGRSPERPQTNSTGRLWFWRSRLHLDRDFLVGAARVGVEDHLPRLVTGLELGREGSTVPRGEGMTFQHDWRAGCI